MSQQPKWGVRKSEVIAACVGMGLGLGLLFQTASLRGQQTKPAEPGSQAGAGAASDVFTKEELAKIKQQVVAHPKVAANHKGHRLQVLRVTKSAGEEKVESGKPPRRLADVILYDHNSGRAERVLFDVARNDVLKAEQLSGVPSPGEEELQEAVRIVQADPELAKLLKAGGQITGGFLAGAPPGAPAHDRYVLMQVLTPDRRDIERSVVVDLSSGTIASSSK
jgi:hypothetical protein